jgi:hypothetical protein
MREKGRVDGLNYTVVPHLSGEGYTLALDNWLSDEDRAHYAPLQTQPVTQPNATAVAEGAPNTSNDLGARKLHPSESLAGRSREGAGLYRFA